MNPLIEKHHQKLEELYRRFHVRKLELFGSAAGERFNPSASDIDLLVTFNELKPGEYADTYFGLLEALQDLYQRPVDLVVASAIKNPYFLEEIEKNRTLLYAA
jgi:predicted nucleotidyltransferase